MIKPKYIVNRLIGESEPKNATIPQFREAFGGIGLHSLDPFIRSAAEKVTAITERPISMWIGQWDRSDSIEFSIRLDHAQIGEVDLLFNYNYRDEKPVKFISATPVKNNTKVRGFAFDEWASMSGNHIDRKLNAIFSNFGIQPYDPFDL